MRVICKCLNEQKAAERFIKDFHDEPWVDDIIAIDCGSTDYTVQILKQFPKVRVFVHPYLDWYHDAEIMHANIMLSYIPNGAIAFSLDFDERCNSALKEFLKQVNISNELPGGADMVHIARRTVEPMRYTASPHAILDYNGWPVESHEIGQFPDFQPRLFRRNPYMHWIQSPHRVITGFKQNHNHDTTCFIEHFNKDDLRDRDWIERRWLRPTAQRRALGLPFDLYECDVKPEYADAADIKFWKA